MTSVSYGICEEIYELDGIKRISYGLVAYADTAEDDTKTILASVRDVSRDRQKLTELAELCNILQLSPIHIQEVIEDLLSE